MGSKNNRLGYVWAQERKPQHFSNDLRIPLSDGSQFLDRLIRPVRKRLSAPIGVGLLCRITNMRPKIA